jgi:hypothetical protein
MNRSRPSREVVWIDQVPLRRSAMAKCRAMMAQLNEAQRQWHHFERKDKPAFVRWRAREFGALLSVTRQVEEKIQQAGALIHEVEQELLRHLQTPQSAYARVMFRRQNPGRAAPEPERRSIGTRLLTAFEQEALFEEWVRKFLGTNPDKMDDAAYESSFALFKSHMFSQTARLQPEQQRERREDVVEEEAEAERTVDERIKILYRRLARQLHPDSRADGSADVSALWHEVQEAYAATDVARMELLLALSHIQSDELGGETSLGEVLLIEEELGRSVRALAKSVREAEKEDAWDFARAGPTRQLTAEVERQLKFNLNNRARYLEQLQSTLASWQLEGG